ncbi:DEAD/DEAH box helicase [Thermus sediminis]|uniref:DEAD/DEAH box helicase n=1 Tax=Thermus sediminis TaxID=1761908 RepID=UPI000E3DD941|nr:DEAD/DEAH box helicase [Thermus sediminis]
MSVFDLHKRAVSEYQDFIRSFVHVADDRLKAYVEERILGEAGHLWPEPLVQLSPAYEPGETVDELAQAGLLHPTTARIFRRADGSPFRLYRHQVEAIRRTREGRSYVLTSGTGSGKSFAYFIPIVDLAVRHPGLKGPLALVVYPMNALVNSQLHALEELQRRYEERYGPFPLRFARYTGQTGEDKRRALRENPPHLLLTNYVMGEYLLTRPEDRALVSPPPSQAPFFLVFDELHTYRGRQGADVALLARRLRARIGERPVLHVGTSATLIAREGATPKERREAVARFASTFFGADIPPEDVVEEVLRPATRGGPPSEEELRAGARTPLPRDLEGFRSHPLARFVEHALGLEGEEGGYRRRRPRPLSQVAEELAKRAGLPPEEAKGLLEEALQVGASLKDHGRPVFAFKLHQFISQTSVVRASLEAPEVREFGHEPFSESGKLLYPLYLCRNCGQDYYAVVEADGRFLPNEALVGGEVEEGEVGYLAFVEDFDPQRDLPEGWFDQRGRLKSPWRERAPRPIRVDLEGRVREEGATEATLFYYQPAPFSLCLRCGADWSGQEREFTKLTYLGSEGRTSATTVLALSLLRKAREVLGEGRDKLLSFTDNRQDASLQAGHFNDFVRSVMVRAALARALEARGALGYEDLAQEVLKALPIPLRGFARNKRLDEGSQAAHQVREAMKDLLRYRLYVDLKRGWRVTQPNLEEVGLLEVAYPYAEDRAFLERVRAGFFPHLSLEHALEAVRFFLDHLRRRLAVETPLLQKEGFERLVRRTAEHLDEFWAIDPYTEIPVLAAAFSPEGGGQVSFSPRSRAGREFEKRFGVSLTPEFLRGFTELLLAHDLLREVEPGLYRIPESALEWRLGDGTPRHDPLRFRGRGEKQANPYFARLYRESAEVLARLEGREHTAQVRPEEREARERRFRGEEEPRLPYLVASPTLELGVDIADLDVVHLRNLPPTPANYAQRVGRAGRQGQPGLVVAFAGAFSHHDRYFFARPQEMVGGSVRPPALELANESLLRAHIHAEWLSATGLSLRESIGDTVNVQDPSLPLDPEVGRQIALSPQARARLMVHLKRIFAYDWDRLSGTGWFGEAWLERVVDEAPLAFDRAFDTWRFLYRAAMEMRERGHRLVESRHKEERERGEAMRREAERQLNLLLQRDVAKEEGDFYPYRYLASEEFLPGYNLMALPVRAFIPRGEGEFLHRPREVAIAEFAPGGVIYHEGGKWRPVALYAPPGGLKGRLSQVWICKACRHLSSREKEVCPGCRAPLAEKGEPVQVLDLVGVRTRRQERITANEEERFRGGYYLEVAYELLERRRAVAHLEEGGFTLVYAPSARIHHINCGLRRSKEEGFFVDLDTGDLLDGEEARRRAQEPRSAVGMGRVALRVQVAQNALLLHLGELLQGEPRETILSLALALKRGMEVHFQVEEQELGLVELGSTLLYYESAEGGLGILRRLVEEEEALAQVASTALGVLHFSQEGEDLRPDCHRACHECLLSYRDQRLAPLLHRHLALPYLRQLRGARVRRKEGGGRMEALLARCQSRLEREFLRLLEPKGVRLPDEAQYRIGEAHTVVDFLYRPNLVVYVDGPHHEGGRQSGIDERQRKALLELGYRVVVVGYGDLEAGVEAVRRALLEAPPEGGLH